MAQAQRTTLKPITAAQIKRIHTVKHILGIADDNYRAALESRFCVTSCKDLTLMQAKSFIDELEKLALKAQSDRYQAQRDAVRSKAEEVYQETEDAKPKRFDNLDNRPGMASAAQLRKIEAMWQDISTIPDQVARSRGLRHFVNRITGVMDLRFLDSECAGKVINAMNAMHKRDMKSEKEQTSQIST
jgi:hypothetical protein